MVAALGLAAGAAVAALFPTSELERRTLSEARDAIAEAASKAGGNLMEAAGEAGERLKAGVAERGMNAEGLKDLARDVAEPFTRAAAGKFDEPRSPEQQKSADAPPKGVEPIAGGGSR
jgi:hypothetical protein